MSGNLGGHWPEVGEPTDDRAARQHSHVANTKHRHSRGGLDRGGEEGTPNLVYGSSREVKEVSRLQNDVHEGLPNLLLREVGYGGRGHGIV